MGSARSFENFWPVICWYYCFSTGEYLWCRSAQAFPGVTFLDTRMRPRSFALSASISASCHFLTRSGDQSLKSLYPPPIIVHQASVTPPASTCLLWPVIAPFLSICCRSPHLLLWLPACTYLESSLIRFNTEKYDSPAAFFFFFPQMCISFFNKNPTQPQSHIYTQNLHGSVIKWLMCISSFSIQNLISNEDSKQFIKNEIYFFFCYK